MKALDYSEAILELYTSREGEDLHLPDRFYSRNDICPFCSHRTSEIFDGGIVEYDPEDRDTRRDIHHSVSAWSCDCGWWTVEDSETPDAHNLYGMTRSISAYRGILRTFSSADTEIPMDTLRRAISKHPNTIDSIGPTKMEELVGAVMADFWPGATCKLCGKSGDGGIDLLLVRGDKPFAIQVKHRQRIDRAEGVHHVTHFIGALVLANIPNGVFVTTADHFSGAAQTAASTVVKREAVESLELVDRSSFLEILERTSNCIQDIWRTCIPREVLENKTRLTASSIHLRAPNSPGK
ncbi:MAG TPA: restriction endonuclease [Terriglobales bacterium]